MRIVSKDLLRYLESKQEFNLKSRDFEKYSKNYRDFLRTQHLELDANQIYVGQVLNYMLRKSNLVENEKVFISVVFVDKGGNVEYYECEQHCNFLVLKKIEGYKYILYDFNSSEKIETVIPPHQVFDYELCYFQDNLEEIELEKYDMRTNYMNSHGLANYLINISRGAIIVDRLDGRQVSVEEIDKLISEIVYRYKPELNLSVILEEVKNGSVKHCRLLNGYLGELLKESDYKLNTVFG